MRIEALEKESAIQQSVLKYLMDAFNEEMWICPACGHDETTADMDSAIFLREFLSGESQTALDYERRVKAEALRELKNSLPLHTPYAELAQAIQRKIDELEGKS
ncbi:MAG: hypothetical protein KGL39_39320 [Patescibacteria group bacterium]|nr:hypothetical protein [Patescibacteria group bacterium]